jgi:hypothetical protein
MLSACMSKDIEMTEQQQRMQRCDQYIESVREDCLRGMNVTIEDYQEEYRAFERSQQTELKKNSEAIKKAVAAQEKTRMEKEKEQETPINPPKEDSSKPIE